MLLSPEVRNDFYIDETRKKIWQIEMNILVAVQEICDRHKLKYFAFAGTMLGAIRHQGFIPWDDDLDIGMLREDYEKFLDVAREELQYPYSLQLSSEKEKYFEAFARVRHCESTAIIEKDKNSLCNNGIFIDIFPFDGLTENISARHKQFNKLKWYWLLLHDYIYIGKGMKHKLLHALLIPFYKIVSFDTMNNKYLKCAMKYNGSKTVGLIVNEPYNEGMYWKKEWLEDVIDVPYEDITIKVPRNYEEILSLHFGDYSKFPPIEERGRRHDHIKFNPDISYKDVLYNPKE